MWLSVSCDVIVSVMWLSVSYDVTVIVLFCGSRYLDVVEFSASVLYDLLMEDVTTLCVTTNHNQVRSKVMSLLIIMINFTENCVWAIEYDICGIFNSV